MKENKKTKTKIKVKTIEKIVRLIKGMSEKMT